LFNSQQTKARRGKGEKENAEGLGGKHGGVQERSAGSCETPREPGWRKERTEGGNKGRGETSTVLALNTGKGGLNQKL